MHGAILPVVDRHSQTGGAGERAFKEPPRHADNLGEREAHEAVCPIIPWRKGRLAKKMNAVKRSLCAAGLGLAMGVAQATSYQAPLHDSLWETRGDREVCVLSHEIPLLGRAEFRHVAGEGVSLDLTWMRAPLIPGRLEVVATPPLWKPDRPSRRLGEARFRARRVSVSLDERVSRWMLRELENGYNPTLIYHQPEGREEDHRIALSVVDVRPSLQAFKECEANLLPYTFGAVRRSTLHFATAQWELDDSARKRLDQIAEYVVADPDIAAIYVTAHTDDVASDRFNMALSRRRALAVCTYLREKGVPAALINAQYRGENWPLVGNRTDADRAKNRRVEIVLEKVE
ncbi:MAG TPA: OmpA family protein [Thiotrichales bacterium]|nr:OmpA family protein [Thiotrichales bacterium]